MKKTLITLILIAISYTSTMAQSTATKSYLNTQLQNQGNKGITSNKIINSLNAVIDYVDSSRAKVTNPTLSGTVIMPGSVTIGNVSSTELSYLDGLTGNIQSQFDNLSGSVFFPSGSATTQVVPNSARSVIVLPTLFTGTTLTLTFNPTFHKSIIVTNYSTTSTVNAFPAASSTGDPQITLFEYKLIPAFFIYGYWNTDITDLYKFKVSVASRKSYIAYAYTSQTTNFYDIDNLQRRTLIITRDGANTTGPSIINISTIQDNTIYSVVRGNASSRVATLTLGSYMYNGVTITGNLNLDKEIRFMRVNDGTTTPYYLVISL